MKFNIREISNKDIEKITQLYIDTYKEDPWNEKWEYYNAKNKINGFLTKEHGENYCILDNNEIIGVMFGHGNFCQNFKELFIDEFFIKHSLQRKGIGNYFLEFIEKEFKQKGYASMALLTMRSYPSELFYSKNGFFTIPDMVLMVKDI